MTYPSTGAGRSLLANYDDKPTETLRVSILAIEREAVEMAGHRIDESHDCFMMNCKALGPELKRLQTDVSDSNAHA